MCFMPLIEKTPTDKLARGIKRGGSRSRDVCGLKTRRLAIVPTQSSPLGTESRGGAVMKILIVDDHPLMREGIRTCLRDFDSTIDSIEAGDLQEAVRAATGQGAIDLVLLDLALPGTAGVATLLSFRNSVDPCPPV